MAIDLRHPKTRQVESAAVVEIELLVLMQQRLLVYRGAEVQAALRKPANHPWLCR